jgi:hypothetical protein
MVPSFPPISEGDSSALRLGIVAALKPVLRCQLATDVATKRVRSMTANQATATPHDQFSSRDRVRVQEGCDEAPTGERIARLADCPRQGGAVENSTTWITNVMSG